MISSKKQSCTSTDLFAVYQKDLAGQGGATTLAVEIALVNKLIFTVFLGVKKRERQFPLFLCFFFCPVTNNLKSNNPISDDTPNLCHPRSIVFVYGMMV